MGAANGRATSSMNDRSFVDTNVLVYLFDADSPAKQARARQILEQDGGNVPLAGSRKGNSYLVLSTQVLQEFYVTVTRKLGVPLAPEVAVEATRRFAELHLVYIDAQLIFNAIALSQRHTVSMWDGLILQAALDGGCTRLLTEDLHDGWNLDGLRIENPFKDLSD